MSRKFFLALLGLTVFAGGAAPVPAQAEGRSIGPHEIFVSPSGDDTNPGTREKPFATIDKAQAEARVCVANTRVSRHVRVVLQEGVYRLAKPLVFTAEDSTKDTLVQYAADKDAKVVLSGGEEIRGWKAVGDVWQAELPDVKAGKWNFVDLYVGEERRPRARTPNEGYLRIERAGDDKRTSFFYRPGDVSAWAKPDEAEVVFLHDWTTSRISVKAIDESARRLSFTDPIGANAPHYAIDGFERTPRYFLEGAREFLDAPGEWHLDTAAGVLTYKPLLGEKLDSFVAVAPRLDNLIAVCGTSNARVKTLGFDNLTLAYCGWLPSPHGFAGYQACFFEDRTGEKQRPTRANTTAAVKVDFADSVGLIGCRVVHHGGCGVWFERNCNFCSVHDCLIDDVGGNGLMVGEIETRPDNEVTKSFFASNTQVRRCGQRYFGAVGIWLGLVSNCTVENCEVSDLPYTGISLGWKWSVEPTSCQANTLSKNHIHHCMQVLSDGGGIYTLGRQPGTVLAGNVIHDIPANAGRAESNGMFLDEGSSEFTVEGNMIYNIAKSPIRFHQATRLTLKNNRLVSAPGVPTFRYNSADPKTMTFEKNEEIVAEKYTLPEGDKALKAGPGTKEE